MACILGGWHSGAPGTRQHCLAHVGAALPRMQAALLGMDVALPGMHTPLIEVGATQLRAVQHYCKVVAKIPRYPHVRLPPPWMRWHHVYYQHEAEHISSISRTTKNCNTRVFAG